MAVSSVVAATRYILSVTTKEEGIKHLNTLDYSDSEAKIAALFLMHVMEKKELLSSEKKEEIIQKISSSKTTQQIPDNISETIKELRNLRDGNGPWGEQGVILFEKLLQWLALNEDEQTDEYGDLSILMFSIPIELCEKGFISEEEMKIMQQRAYHAIRKSPDYEINDPDFRDFLVINVKISY